MHGRSDDKGPERSDASGAITFSYWQNPAYLNAPCPGTGAMSRRLFPLTAVGACPIMMPGQFPYIPNDLGGIHGSRRGVSGRWWTRCVSCSAFTCASARESGISTTLQSVSNGDDSRPCRMRATARTPAPRG